MSIDDVSVSELSLTSARVTAEATVNNPNVFTLGLNRLRYEVRLGDVPVANISASTLDSIAAGAAGGLSLAGQITARAALMKLVQGAGPGQPAVSPAGTILTPYGAVPVSKPQ